MWEFLVGFWQFSAGFCTCLMLVLIGMGVRAYRDLVAARRARRALATLSDEDPRDVAAREKVKDCKGRLRWQWEINPDWIKPLKEELPQLVDDIARCYYPDVPDPLLAPGLSQFARAIEKAAADVVEILESKFLGRMVNVSANTAMQTYRMGRSISENSTFRFLGRWHKKLAPLVQAARYNSPLMWTSLIANNVACRLVQPAIVDIVARRVIELYSGRLLDDGVKEAAREAVARAEREIVEAAENTEASELEQKTTG